MCTNAGYESRMGRPPRGNRGRAVHLQKANAPIWPPSPTARLWLSPPARLQQALAHVGMLAGFVLLSIILTYPLVKDLGSRVLGWPGDNFEYLYKLWWFKDALFDLKVTPLVDPSIFYPFGYDLALTELTLSNVILALPLVILFGEVVAYNLTMLLSFPLSGLAMYLLVLHYTRSKTAGCIAGVIFAFCPFRMLHLGVGHLPLIATQWLPLLFLYLDRMVERQGKRDALMAGIFYSFGALSAWYYAYMFAMAGILYVLLKGRPWRKHLRQPGFLSCVVVFALVCMVLVGPVLLHMARAWQSTSRTWSLAYLDQLSASPLDFLYPSVLHPLWGSRLMESYPQHLSENVLYLGLMPLALGTIALWRPQDKRHRLTSPEVGQEKTRRVYVWIVVVFFILALGTTLHWKNSRVYIAVPGWVERVFTVGMSVLTKRLAVYPISSYTLRVEGAIYLPLPTLLLYLYLPFFSGMRVWARFGLLTIFALAALAGFGVQRLQRWITDRTAASVSAEHGVSPPSWRGSTSGHGIWRPWLVPLVIGLLVIFEFAALPYAMGSSSVQARPVDHWLSEREGDFAIMEYPLIKAMSGTSYYHMRTHGKRISFGQSTYFPQFFTENRPLLESFPSAESITLLKSWGVRYVLVGSRYYGATWPQLERSCSAAPGLRYVLTMDDMPIYEGDRVLHLMPGAERAFIVDRIYVYEVL